MTNLVAVSIYNTQLIVLKCPFLFKKIEGPLGEIDDSRGVAGNIQDEPGISCLTR